MPEALPGGPDGRSHREQRWHCRWEQYHAGELIAYVPEVLEKCGALWASFREQSVL